jgi:hypothetical protein
MEELEALCRTMAVSARLDPDRVRYYEEDRPVRTWEIYRGLATAALTVGWRMPPEELPKIIALLEAAR